MELATRKLTPRLKPLAAFLATGLAISAGSAVTGAKAISQQQLEAKELASLPARLRAGTVPRLPPWRRQAPVVSMAEHHHPLPHAIPDLPISTVPVTNCNDSGAGSLRDALQNALDGDTVDMTGLSCSVISLTTGSILFGQNSITLQGPGASNLFLSGGSGPNRVTPLLHDGTGTLTINDMTVEDGAKYFSDAQFTSARGGCILSTGFVSLNDSEVKYCTAQNTGSTYGARGGAVYAMAGVSLSNTSILDSSVYANHTYADGGGIFTPGSVTIAYSSVEGNTSSGSVGGVDAGHGALVKYSNISGNEALTIGGLYSYSSVTIENSTIASNTAYEGAGLWLNGTTATGPITLLNSTVSGNNATGYANGGVFIFGNTYTALVANNTIAFNTTHYAGAPKYGAGIRILGGSIDLESNIIAGNTNDDGSGVLNDDIDGLGITLIGANNLIVAASVTPPPDTISADPQLLPLNNNGGLTETHAISISSPAINAGNNTAGVAFDQRGPGFPRVIGAAADIGAYEFNLDDVIFRDGFE